MDLQLTEKISVLVEYFKNEIELTAAQGNAELQCILGFCYLEGIGVPRDFEKSFEWLTKSAEGNNGEAQFWLGYMYYDGYGIDKDFFKAHPMFRLSAENGYHEAQYYLGRCYYEGCGTDKDYEQAVKWLKLAVEQGNAAACTLLAECYSKCLGIDGDEEEASMLLELSLKLYGYFNRDDPDDYKVDEEADEDNEKEEDQASSALKEMHRSISRRSYEKFWEIYNRNNEQATRQGRNSLLSLFTMEMMNLDMTLNMNRNE